MYTLEELKKASWAQEKKKAAGPSKEDAIYQKYLESKETAPKVSGGTVNPIITTARVQENRNLKQKKSQTYAEALGKSRSTASRLGAGLEKAKASVQDVKDILFSGRNYGTVNPTFSLGKEYDSMTENEAGIYTSLAKRGKKEEASTYLKALQMDLNQRNAAQMQERAKQTAQKNILGGIGMDVAGAMSSGAGAAYSLWQEAKGEAIDPYHPAFGGATMQAGAAEGLLGESTGAKRLLKQAALATAEWGGQALGYGIFAPVAMAAGAAGSSMQDATLRGGTAEEAAFYGLTSGTAEMAAEKMGFDRYLGILDKIAPAKGNKAQLAKMIAKEMGAEGLEEGATEIANILADMAILGEKSNMNGIYQDAQASGKSKGAAAWEAAKAAAGQVGESFAVGALSGGMIGGGLAGADIAAGKDPLARARAQYEAATKPAEVSYHSTKAVEKAVDNGGEGVDNSAKVVEKAAGAVDNAVEETAERAEQPLQAGKTAVDNRAEENETQIEGFGEKYYGEKGKSLFLQKAQERGNLDFTPAFNTYYRAGLIGLSEKEIKQTVYTAAADKLLLNEARMAGMEDRKAELANAIRGKSKISGERGLILGEDTKATEAQLALAGLYADIGGAKIKLIDHIDAEEGYHVNGMQEGDIITIALDADSFSGTLHHEMIHYIRKANPEGFDTLRELVFTLAQESGIDIEAQMEKYRSKYEEIYGEDAEMTAYMEEMTADAFEKLAADKESLKSLLDEIRKKDKTLLERIKEFLEKMAQTLESLFKDNAFTDFAEAISKDKANVEKLQEAFAWALTETGKAEMRTEEEGAKYALKKDNKGKEYWAIDTEKDIFKGIKGKKELRQAAYEWLLNGEKGESIKEIIDGEPLYFTRISAKEYTYGRQSQTLSAEEYKQKMRMAPSIEDLVAHANIHWKAPDQKKHKMFDGEFLNYRGRVGIDDVIFTYVVRIGEKNGEHIFYDINLEADAKVPRADARLSYKENRLPLQENIAQDGEESNDKNVTRFSLRKSVEETKDLIAVHNLNEENLKGALQLGGFPMPSIAIVKDNMGHEKYGDISLVFGKETIEAAGRSTAQQVKNHFAKEGYQITDRMAKEIVELYQAAANMPTGYFEAKPKRAVGLEEIRAAIVPDNMKTEMKTRLEEQGIATIEYTAGNSESRLRALNSVRDVKFSIRKDDIEAAIAEDTDWKAAYEGLLREFEITREPLKDRESAQKVVHKFLKSIKSGYNEDIFLERFISLCNYGADMQSDSNYRDLLTAMTMLAEDALQESLALDTKLYDEYAELRKEMRLSTIFVSEDTVRDLAEQDIRYSDLRKENFGKMKISRKSGTAIDTQYAEWAEKYPALFQSDGATSQAELLLDMIAIRKSLDPVIENPYFGQMEDYAEACAYELLGMMNEVALEKPTFADKYEERLRKQREESREALRKAREKAKHEQTRLRAQYTTREEAAIAAVKEKYEKRLDRREYWRLRELMAKDARTLAEWLKAPTDKNHVPKKFTERVETILSLLDTDKPDLKIPLQEFVKMRGGLTELYGDTQGLYLYVQQDDQVINILDKFIQKYPDGANLDAMDAGDMKDLRNLVATVKKACTDANKMHTSEREKTAVAVSEEFITSSRRRKDAKETGIFRRAQEMLGLEMLDANSFFKRMGGDIYKELWKGLRRGMDKKTLHWKDAMDFINELADPKKVRKWTDEAAKEFDIQGTKVYLTIPQIMSLACLMRRKQGKQHILGADISTESGILHIQGGGFKAEPLGKDKKAKPEKAKVAKPTKEDIENILNTLTEEQAQVAYAIQKYLSTEVAAWGNETTMQLFGYEKFTTEHYFPIVSDKNFVRQEVGQMEEIAPSLRRMGMTKNINQYANNPVMIQDIFKVFANHIDQMSNYNAFVASESDFNKFLNYKAKREDGTIESVKDEMERTMGKGGAKYIKTLMNRLVTANGLSDDSDFAKMLVRNMKVASVGANLRVIAQQPTAYLRAANQIDLKYLLNPAVFRRTDKEIIYQYAPIALWKSWGNYEMDTGKTMYEQIIAPKIWNKSKEFLMAGAGLADEWTWSRLWNACVLEAKDKHGDFSEEEIYRTAGRRFGEVVDESQVVDSVLHRSQIMRKKGLYTQMATSFMSEPTKTFNMASNALLELIRHNTPKNRKKFIRCYMSILFSGIATACAAGLVDAMRDDDDEEEFLEKWKKAVAGDYSEAEKPQDFVMAALSNNIADNLNPMGMIPYLRDAWSLMQGYDINRTDFDWLNDIIKNMKRWHSFMIGESEYTLASMLMNTTGALSKMTGVPLGSAERDLQAAANLVVYYIIGKDEAKYEYRKFSKDIGAKKNASDYAERILRAKFSGNDALATRIYNEMIAAGISNDTIDGKLEAQEKARLKEEAAAEEAAKAYAAGDYEGYMRAVDSLTAKGYSGKSVTAAIRSIYNKMQGAEDEEEAETFDTITNAHWHTEAEDAADYEMLFNAYMNGSGNDYAQLWDTLEAAGKEETNIKSSMKNRLKKAYQAAKEEGDYHEAQKAKQEFLRLGGKMETLEKD